MTKEKTSEIIVSLILTMFGIFLIVWADKVTNIFSMIAGIVIVIFGIIKIFSYFQSKNDIMELIYGILIVVLGGVLIFNASFIKELLSFIATIRINSGTHISNMNIAGWTRRKSSNSFHKSYYNTF